MSKFELTDEARSSGAPSSSRARASATWMLFGPIICASLLRVEVVRGRRIIVRTSSFIVWISSPPEVTNNDDFPVNGGDDGVVVVVVHAWYQSSVASCIHNTHALTHSCAFTYTRTRTRADLEEAKGEKEGEDVDSPPSDRDRVVQRDAVSCCRSTASGSLKVSPYRRWTGVVGQIARGNERSCSVCRCCFLVGAIPRRGR